MINPGRKIIMEKGNWRRLGETTGTIMKSSTLVVLIVIVFSSSAHAQVLSASAEAFISRGAVDLVGPQNVDVPFGDYEHIVYVSQSTGSDLSGTGSMATPWAKLSYALSQLNDAAEDNRYAILVAEGTYTGKAQRHSDSDPVDDPTRIHMRPYIDLYGGHDPSGWTRDIFEYVTILDGENQHRVLYGEDNAGIDGFVVARGRTRYNGAGVFCNGSSPSITNNFVVDNAVAAQADVAHGGGGIYRHNSNGEISNNLISLNSGGTERKEKGGGISSIGGSLQSNFNIISHNEAYRGTGVFAEGGTYTILNTLISDNTAFGSSGAGIFLESSQGDTLIGNSVICNNTVAGWQNGSGIFSLCMERFTLLNSVVYGNGSSTRRQIFLAGDDNDIRYCLLDGLLDSPLDPTVITGTDPGFLDEEAYRLAPGSPLIDAGQPGAAFNDACLPPGLGTERNDIGAYGGPTNCGFVPVYRQATVSIATGMTFDPRVSEVLNVPVSINNIEAVADVAITITFDGSILQADTPTTTLPGTYDWTISDDSVAGTIHFSEPAVEPGSAVLFTIPFTLTPEAEQGESSRLQISGLDVSGDGSEVFVVDSSDGSVYVAYEVVVYGDVNGDGKADVIDVLMVMRDIVQVKELTAEQEERADVIDDGVIDVQDAMEVYNAALGVSTGN